MAHPRSVLTITVLCVGLLLIAHICGSHLALAAMAVSSEAAQPVQPTDSWRPIPPAHDAKLVERLHVDDTPEPVATEEEKTQGYLVFSRHYLDLIFPNSVPKREEVVRELSALASPGEYEPVTFAIYALRDLEGVRVVASDLCSADGTRTIPTANVDVRQARCTFKRITHYSGPGEFMYMPTWLATEKALDLPAQHTAWLWLDIHVPAECTPGAYTGTVTISAHNGGTSMLSLKLRVLPIALAETTDMGIGFYDGSYAERFFPMEKRFADMRAFGMTSVGYAGDSGIAFTLKDGKLSADVAGSELARVMRAYQAAGFRSPLLWLAAQDIWLWCAEQADPQSERFAQLYVDIHRAIRRQAESEGWPEIIIQPEDECPGYADKWQRALRKLPLLKEAGFRTEMDQFFAYPDEANTAAVNQALPNTDVITIVFSMKEAWYQPPWPDCVARVVALDKILWTYNIDRAMSWPQPTSHRFYTGFFFRTLAPTCKGMYFWTYAYGAGDPYNGLDQAEADWTYYYPEDPTQSLSGGPSLTIVYMREGLDDLRYVQTLEKLIASASRSSSPDTRQAAQRAQRKLDRILESFRFTWAAEWPWLVKLKAENCDSTWDVYEERGRMKTAGGKFIYRNGWDFSDYDRARRTIASEIIRLQRAAEKSN